MSIIFTSVFYGAYIIWDRKFDFLKSVMVTPVKERGHIFRENHRRNDKFNDTGYCVTVYWILNRS